MLKMYLNSLKLILVLVFAIIGLGSGFHSLTMMANIPTNPTTAEMAVAGLVLGAHLAVIAVCAQLASFWKEEAMAVSPILD